MGSPAPATEPPSRPAPLSASETGEPRLCQRWLRLQPEQWALACLFLPLGVLTGGALVVLGIVEIQRARGVIPHVEAATGVWSLGVAVALVTAATLSWRRGVNIDAANRTMTLEWWTLGIRLGTASSPGSRHGAAQTLWISVI